MPTLFDAERTRHVLSISKKYTQFISTYTENVSNILNSNTSKKWDVLNSRTVNLRNEDPMAHERISYVANSVYSKSKILDIGFGSGNLEEELWKFSHKLDLTGIDMSPLSVRSAKRRFRKWNFFVRNIVKDQLPPTDFDCVIALEVLEHISPRDLFKTYKKISQKLTKNGLFIVSVPLNEGLEELMKIGKNPNAHVRAYTPAILFAELNVAGFDVVRSKQLYAFHKLHIVKSIIAQFSFGLFKPNNIIVIARKS